MSGRDVYDTALMSYGAKKAQEEDDEEGGSSSVYDDALKFAQDHPQIIGMIGGAMLGRSLGRKFGRSRTRKWEIEDARDGRPTLYGNEVERAGGHAGIMLGTPAGSIAATAVSSPRRKK